MSDEAYIVADHVKAGLQTYVPQVVMLLDDACDVLVVFFENFITDLRDMCQRWFEVSSSWCLEIDGDGLQSSWIVEVVVDKKTKLCW